MASGRGLFVDLDGTLADSTDVLRLCYMAFLDRFHRTGSEQEFSSLIGPPLVEVIRRLIDAHGLHGGVDDLAAFYRSLIDRNYLLVRPARGARDLLSRAKARDYVIGVVTSNNRKLTADWLARTELDRWTDFVIAAEDISEGKPSAEPYAKALIRGGCGAEMSVGIEDSPQGAWSAVTARLQTYALSSPKYPDEDWPSDVIFVTGLTDIAEIMFNE